LEYYEQVHSQSSALATRWIAAYYQNLEITPMQNVLTTLATVTEIAALAYFSLGFVCYVIQQSSSSQSSQLAESVSQPEVAEVTSTEPMRLEETQPIAEEAIQPTESKLETVPDVSSPNSKQLGIRELRLIARDRGIKGFSRMKKDELLARLA
jgi:hypothetical protein